MYCHHHLTLEKREQIMKIFSSQENCHRNSDRASPVQINDLTGNKAKQQWFGIPPISGTGKLCAKAKEMQDA